MIVAQVLAQLWGLVSKMKSLAMIPLLAQLATSPVSATAENKVFWVAKNP